MFWIKKPKLVLDCFTEYSHVYELAPLDKAIKFLPNWWKSVPKTIPSLHNNLADDSTIKTCPGVIEQYKNGIIIPLWTDILIDIAPIGIDGYRAQAADARTPLNSHPHEQRGIYLPNEKYQHIKIGSPWFLKTNESINWQLLQPVYNYNTPDKVVILPGMLNFKYQRQTNVNMIFTRSADVGTKHRFKRGQPLIQLIPYTEKELVIKTHLVSQEEITKLNSLSYHSTFHNNYHKMVSILKAKDKRCPFH